MPGRLRGRGATQPDAVGGQEPERFAARPGLCMLGNLTNDRSWRGTSEISYSFESQQDGQTGIGGDAVTFPAYWMQQQRGSNGGAQQQFDAEQDSGCESEPDAHTGCHAVGLLSAVLRAGAATGGGSTGSCAGG